MSNSTPDLPGNALPDIPGCFPSPLAHAVSPQLLTSSPTLGVVNTTSPPSTLPPLINEDEHGLGPMPVLSSTATEEEIIAHERRLRRLERRMARQRRQQQRQLFEEAVPALRVKVAQLRSINADFGLPPLHAKKQEPRSPSSIESELDGCLGPRPPSPKAGGAGPSHRRQQSVIAQWAFRRRRMQHLLLLEDEAADLKAEVAQLHAQMSTVGFGAKL
ncbi:hypothetical protein C8R44DRAFT_293928 [Mycena epipterygia]|nr:hypothetical protein C8R44DRAFT_293928 [Mycena epipterygia]